MINRWNKQENFDLMECIENSAKIIKKNSMTLKPIIMSPIEFEKLMEIINEMSDLQQRNTTRDFN